MLVEPLNSETVHYEVLYYVIFIFSHKHIFNKFIDTELNMPPEVKAFISPSYNDS